MAVTRRLGGGNGGSRTGRDRGNRGVQLEGPARSQRGIRWSELTVGLLVTVLSAVTGIWLHARSIEREPVLVLRVDVARGEPLSSEHVRVVLVGVDDDLRSVPPEALAELEGRPALIDLRAGTLVTADQFAVGRLVAAGEGVVGLALEPGEYPSTSLRAGDVVRVVTPSGEATEAAPRVLVGDAEVVDVAPMAGQDRLLVSLAMPAGDADEVAAAGDQVRLVQVRSGR